MRHEDAIDRVKKLLRLAAGAGTEAEAALAAERAADLMREYHLAEAQIAAADVEVRPDEEIIPRGTIEGEPETRRRIAWKGTIAHAVIHALGGRQFWTGAEIRLFGRKSDVQAASYMCAYLFREVNRLCDEAADKERPSSARSWKNAFRVGAAARVAQRMLEDSAAAEAARAAAPETKALVLVKKREAEVHTAYRDYSQGWGQAVRIGYTSNTAGWRAGRRAAESIRLGGAKAALGAGAPRLPGGGQ
jgi:uncharacterized protein DUF2786